MSDLDIYSKQNFGNRIGFFFVNVVGRADSELRLENSRRQNPPCSTISQTSLHRENWTKGQRSLRRDGRICNTQGLSHGLRASRVNCMRLDFYTSFHRIPLS